MAVRHETELYAPVKAFFERRGYDVKAEVMHCDLVAVKPEDETTVIVEMKKTFNLALLLQGVERLRLTDRVVLAVERNRSKSGAVNQRFGDLAELCRMLGIGLLTVTFFKTKAPVVEVLCEPGEPPVRGMRRTRQSRLQQEFRERSGDYNIGGSTGRKLVTAYREKALRIALALHEHGPLAPRTAAELTGNRRAAGMLRDDYYGWFERVERGIYRLRAAGELALTEHADVIGGWAAAAEAESGEAAAMAASVGTAVKAAGSEAVAKAAGGGATARAASGGATAMAADGKAAAKAAGSRRAPKTPRGK